MTARDLSFMGVGCWLASAAERALPYNGHGLSAASCFAVAVILFVGTLWAFKEHTRG